MKNLFKIIYLMLLSCSTFAQNGEDWRKKYSYVSPQSEGMMQVLKNDLHGYVDSLGNEVIPLVYKNSEPFSEGLACVYKDYQYGFIDKSNRVVIPFDYENATSFHDGLALFKKNLSSRIGYMNHSQKVIFYFIDKRIKKS